MGIVGGGVVVEDGDVLVMGGVEKVVCVFIVELV